MSITEKFSQRAGWIKSASIRLVNERIAGLNAISFTAGKPAPHLFPVELAYEQTGNMLEKYGGDAMQYSPTQGFLPLREWIAKRTPPAKAENIQMAAGSQQAIDLTGKLFVDPGDLVVVSDPTYTTAINTLSMYGAKYIGIPCDNAGMLTEKVEQALQQSPKLIYCTPNFMNPSGVSMSLERRQQLAALAQAYDTPILEDDPYGALRFEGEHLPNLYELAPQHVIYAGTFSKVIAPGFRLGWIAANQSVLKKLTQTKQSSDLQVSTYVQMLVCEMLETGFYDAQVAKARNYYHRQRDSMLTAMQRHFPPQVQYESPAGGMFFWASLPEGMDAGKVLEAAIDAKVAYVPGQSFYANGEGKNTMRLSFSVSTEEEIKEGIKRLGDVFRREIAYYEGEGNE